METWAWLVAYLVGFALLQLVLYRYFQRGESTHEQGEAPEPGYKRLEGAARADADAGVEDPDSNTVVCQQCGALNERNGTYSYCRECAGPLR